MIIELLAGAACISGLGLAVATVRAIRRSPDGYQDAQGFHYGETPAPVPAPVAANSNQPSLTDDQQLVILQMSDESGYTAAWLAKWTGLPEKRVSEIRRELAALGLANYSPLFDPDLGHPKGSGYLLTPAGLAVRDALDALAFWDAA